MSCPGRCSLWAAHIQAVRELLLPGRVIHIGPMVFGFVFGCLFVCCFCFLIFTLFFIFSVSTVPGITVLKHFGSPLTQRGLKQNLLY